MSRTLLRYCRRSAPHLPAFGRGPQSGSRAASITLCFQRFTLVRVDQVGPPQGALSHFYEKVVKVKADVAANPNFFSRSRKSKPTSRRGPEGTHSGGCARGVSAERFETPLAGGVAAVMCASAFCWHTACQRRGGNPPAHAFPWGKRERGSADFLAAAGCSRWHSANVGHAAGLLCARSCSTFLSIKITNL